MTVTLSFWIESQEEMRTVEGLVEETNPLVVEESHENRPNWRVHRDGRVDLLSPNGTVCKDFGTHASVDGFCLMHQHHYEHEVMNRCFMCEEERRAERMRVESMLKDPYREPY